MCLSVGLCQTFVNVHTDPAFMQFSDYLVHYLFSTLMFCILVCNYPLVFASFQVHVIYCADFHAVFGWSPISAVLLYVQMICQQQYTASALRSLSVFFFTLSGSPSSLLWISCSPEIQTAGLQTTDLSHATCYTLQGHANSSWAAWQPHACMHLFITTTCMHS